MLNRLIEHFCLFVSLFRGEQGWEKGDQRRIFFYIVKVANQKSLKSGDQAPVTFSSEEFDVLKIFIKDMGLKLCNDRFNKFAFPSKLTCTGKLGKGVSLPLVNRILKANETKSGKEVTSRNIRKSKISNFRCKNPSYSECYTMAKAMSHTVAHRT